jgi:hypothetical protein
MPKHPIYSNDFIYSEPEKFLDMEDTVYWVRSVQDKTGFCVWEVGMESSWNKDGQVAYCGKFLSRERAISKYKP